MSAAITERTEVDDPFARCKEIDAALKAAGINLFEMSMEMFCDKQKFHASEKKTKQLLSRLDSIGWQRGLTEESYNRIATAGFRGDNDVLAAIVCDLCAEHQPITLRGLFYQVVSAGALPSTDDKYYDRVGRIVTTLRRQGILPYAWIVDNIRSTLKPSSWSGLQDFSETVKNSYRKDFWANLDVYVHVFCEKDAIAGVIDPVTSEYDVALSPIRGYCSETFAHEVGSQWAKIDKPIFAYYLGDYDPSGFDIERDLRAKLKSHSGVDFTWKRLAVNKRDFKTFNLIKLKPKKSDMRYAQFVQDHGTACAEVDAIPPKALRDRITKAITKHIPQGVWERLQTVESAEKESFNKLLKGFK